MNKKYGNFLNLSKGIEAFRMLGPSLFFRNLGRQLYSSIPYFVMVQELDRFKPADEKVSLAAASAEDVVHFFDLMAKESRLSQIELLTRREFYQKGFHDCLIGRTIDSNEICSINWFVTAEDVRKTRSENYYPALKADEVIGENIYILEKFRKKGVASSSARRHRAIAQKRGYKRMLFYIREDNVPSIAVSQRSGDLIIRRIVRRKLLFQLKTKIIEQFDPPVSISLTHSTGRAGKG